MNAFNACGELGIHCDITLAYEDKIINKTKSLVQCLLRFAPKELIRVTKVFPSGRGNKQVNYQSKPQKYKSYDIIPCLFASVPYIFPNGDILPCIGPIANLPRKHNPLFFRVSTK